MTQVRIRISCSPTIFEYSNIVFSSMYLIFQCFFVKQASAVGFSQHILACESMIYLSNFFRNYLLFHFFVAKENICKVLKVGNVGQRVDCLVSEQIDLIINMSIKNQYKQIKEIQKAHFQCSLFKSHNQTQKSIMRGQIEWPKLIQSQQNYFFNKIFLEDSLRKPLIFIGHTSVTIQMDGDYATQQIILGTRCEMERVCMQVCNTVGNMVSRLTSTANTDGVFSPERTQTNPVSPGLMMVVAGIAILIVLMMRKQKALPVSKVQ